MPIEGDELCALDRRSIRAVKILAAIFRDVRPSRDLAGRLEGGLLPSLGHAVRERQMGAVSPGEGFFGSQRSGGARARAARSDDQAVVAARPRSTMCCRSTTASARALRKTPRASTARATSSPFTPAWDTCRPTSRPTCAAAATPSRPMWRLARRAPRAC